MNVEYLNTRFILYNKLLFSDKLPKETIIYLLDLSNDNLLGSFDIESKSISIHCELEIHEVDKVLIHEMIHLWEFIRFERCGHGKIFRDKAKRIRKITKFKIPIYGDELKLEGLLID